jgi:hypothetical protein
MQIVCMFITLPEKTMFAMLEIENTINVKLLESIR